MKETPRERRRQTLPLAGERSGLPRRLTRPTPDAADRAQVGPDVIAALGRHCGQLAALRVETYAPARAPGAHAPDFGELAVLTSLEDLDLSFVTPGPCAPPHLRACTPVRQRLRPLQLGSCLTCIRGRNGEGRVALLITGTEPAEAHEGARQLPRPGRLRLPRRAQLGAGARALGAGAAERAGAAAARAVGRAGRRLSPARAGRAGARWRAVLCRRCGAGARMPTCRGPHPSPWRHRASGRRPAAHPRSRLSGLHCADGAWGLIGSELSVSLPGILAWPGAVAPTCHRAATLFFARAGVLSRGPDRRGDARAVGGRGGAAGADLADVPRARDGRPAAGRLAAPGGRRGARAPAPARPAGGAGRAGGSRRRRRLPGGARPALGGARGGELETCGCSGGGLTRGRPQVVQRERSGGPAGSVARCTARRAARTADQLARPRCPPVSLRARTVRVCAWERSDA